MAELKNMDEYFTDWESWFFGYGYGSGEEYILPAIKIFFQSIPESGAYNYRVLEQKLGGEVTWLLINMFCAENYIDYGTSPRCGWLTPKAKSLQAYISSHDIYEVIAKQSDDYIHCYPDLCNCDCDSPCDNPFWRKD